MLDYGDSSSDNCSARSHIVAYYISYNGNKSLKRHHISLLRHNKVEKMICVRQQCFTILMQCTYLSFFLLSIYEVVMILFLLCQYCLWSVD